MDIQVPSTPISKHQFFVHVPFERIFLNHNPFWGEMPDYISMIPSFWAWNSFWNSWDSPLQTVNTSELSAVKTEMDLTLQISIRFSMSTENNKFAIISEVFWRKSSRSYGELVMDAVCLPTNSSNLPTGKPGNPWQQEIWKSPRSEIHKVEDHPRMVRKWLGN